MNTDPIAQAHREALLTSQPGTQTYLVEIAYRDIGTLRDALDLAHRDIMLTRTLMRALGKPVSKGPGPLRRQIVKLQKNFPRFTRYDPDPCFGIHNFVDDDLLQGLRREVEAQQERFRAVGNTAAASGLSAMYPLIDAIEAPAHCTECGAERLNAGKAVA